MFTSERIHDLTGLTIESRIVRAASAFATAAVKRARAVADLVLKWDERARMRYQLQALDERMLKDIGLSRTDTVREVAKPFWRE